MSQYRRIFIPGGTYFFTVVTYKHKPIFNDKKTNELLNKMWRHVSKNHPFTTDAFCLLPDHFHCVITLPENDSNYPLRIREIKRLFSRMYRIYDNDSINVSRLKRAERTIWQRRYWEHTIRNDKDLDHHIQYIHFNPVKHGYVERVKDWYFSSFHQYVRLGLVDENWGEGFIEINQINYGE